MGDLWSTSAAVLLVSWMAKASSGNSATPPFLADTLLEKPLSLSCPAVASGTPSLGFALAVKRICGLGNVPGTFLQSSLQEIELPARTALARCVDPTCGLIAVLPFGSGTGAAAKAPPACSRCQKDTQHLGNVLLPVKTLAE